jgi:hypothetical protein
MRHPLCLQSHQQQSQQCGPISSKPSKLRATSIVSLRSHKQQFLQVASNQQTQQSGFIPAQKTAALLLA